jgi:hypothetical protein
MVQGKIVEVGDVTHAMEMDISNLSVIVQVVREGGVYGNAQIVKIAKVIVQAAQTALEELFMRGKDAEIAD